MNAGFLNALITEHGNEILLVLVSVLVVRGIRLILHRRKRKKEIQKEKEQAEKLMRDEALNAEILNPDRRPGDVSEQKHPYRVEYSEHNSSGQDMRRKSPHRRNLSGGGPVFGRDQKVYKDGPRLRVTECSSLSKRSYMFKRDEIMRVGNQYGKTGILAGDSDDSIPFFEIYSRNNCFYLNSSGETEIVISRGGNRKRITKSEIVLYDDDRIAVQDKIYEIRFF